MENDSDEEMGVCDICGKSYPIGRGDNFNWIEETSKWACINCQRNEVDMSAELEADQVRLENANPGRFKIEIVDEESDPRKDGDGRYIITGDERLTSLDEALIHEGENENSQEREEEDDDEN
jgi:hypothetical protein